jgi:hypothetical protein
VVLGTHTPKKIKNTKRRLTDPAPFREDQHCAIRAWEGHDRDDPYTGMTASNAIPPIGSEHLHRPLYLR